MTDKYSYSSTEDNFTGEFDTREAAIEEAQQEYAGLKLKHFWTGRNVPVDPLLYVHADWLIEHIVNHDDFCIEQADGWPDCTIEQKEELTAALREVFRDWMTRHKLEPTFWLVEDVQRHEIEDETKEDILIQPITLGELIKQLSRCAPTAYVRFDFCGLRPDVLRSYRGYYEQLALGWKEDGQVTVEQLLKECKEAVGKVYEGYKGGEFEMDESTPVWVANYGRSTGTAIKKVKSLGEYSVILITRYVD